MPAGRAPRRVEKVVVTSRSALRRKYGGEGLAAVLAVLAELAKADAERGLTSRTVFLDDRATMRRLGGAPVEAPEDAPAAKAAVDAVTTALLPDYVVIVGGPDVVPQQPLRNPLFTGDPAGDPDATADGDLPYACDVPYAEEPGAFVGPTRVVGRVPDLRGSRDPDYLVSLLRTAAGWQQRDRSEHARVFALSTASWQNSTSLSLTRLVGSDADLQLVPPRKARWPKARLSRRTHFINCHGADADFRWYGEGEGEMPVAHEAAYIASRISEGTIVAAECCYGAQLYDPTLTGGQAGIAQTYLAGGAYGVFGSSTVAYGPAVGNGSADLICQAFMRHVLAGASLGRAALQARQDFVAGVSLVDPVDLKTLAQFDLLGDPSIHPVRSESDIAPAPKRAGGPLAHLAVGRGNRRIRLAATGEALRTTTAVPEREESARPTREVRSLPEAAGAPEAAAGPTLTFRTRDEQRFHVLLGRPREDQPPTAVVARERGGRLAAYRVLYAK